jgi:hypothetical protein
MDNFLFTVRGVKDWFIDLFPGVDASATLKSYQKFNIPAHHPDDIHYRFVINDGPRFSPPLDMFKQIQLDEQSHYSNIKNIFDIPLDEIHTITGVEDKCRDQLSKMYWDRGCGNDVHGNLLRIANRLQHAGLDHTAIIMQYAPKNLLTEVKAMKNKIIK